MTRKPDTASLQETATGQPPQERSLRDTINELTESLIVELSEETLTPMEKLALLRTLLPYAVGKLPNVAVNLAIRNGQPTSARIIEPTKDGGDDSSNPFGW